MTTILVMVLALPLSPALQAAFHGAASGGAHSEPQPKGFAFKQESYSPASPGPPQFSNGEPYMLGAWYFPAWSDWNDYQAVNAESLYGYRDPWGGVREYALGQDPLNIGGNYSSREPLLGFYDLTDQQVMNAHILQAASRGLSYFAFYADWDP